MSFGFPGICNAAIRLVCQLLYDLCSPSSFLAPPLSLSLSLPVEPGAPVHSQLFRATAWAKRLRALAGPSRPSQGEGGIAERRLPQLLAHLPQPLPLIRILGCGRYPHRRGIALHSP